MLRAKELRALDISELKTKVEELKHSYSKEFVKVKVGSKTEKAVNLRNIRKDVARVLTTITEKEMKTLKNKEEAKIKQVSESKTQKKENAKENKKPETKKELENKKSKDRKKGD